MEDKEKIVTMEDKENDPPNEIPQGLPATLGSPGPYQRGFDGVCERAGVPKVDISKDPVPDSQEFCSNEVPTDADERCRRVENMKDDCFQAKQENIHEVGEKEKKVDQDFMFLHDPEFQDMYHEQLNSEAGKKVHAIAEKYGTPLLCLQNTLEGAETRKAVHEEAKATRDHLGQKIFVEAEETRDIIVEDGEITRDDIKKLAAKVDIVLKHSDIGKAAAKARADKQEIRTKEQACKKAERRAETTRKKAEKDEAKSSREIAKLKTLLKTSKDREKQSKERSKELEAKLRKLDLGQTQALSTPSAARRPSSAVASTGGLTRERRRVGNRFRFR